MNKNFFVSRWDKLKLLCILLFVASSAGCAVALIDHTLGENKANHADDQSIEAGDNQGQINN